MSSIFKCLFAIFAVVCFLQFIEMARLRRDEPGASAGEAVQKALDELMSKMKAALEDENIKKAIEAAAQKLGQTSTAVKDQLEKLTNNIGNAAQKAANSGN